MRFINEAKLRTNEVRERERERERESSLSCT